MICKLAYEEQSSA